VNVSQVVWYREQVERQKIEEVKLVEIDEVKEWKKQNKIRGVVKYLVWWKGFIAENNTWERGDDLENTKKK